MKLLLIIFLLFIAQAANGQVAVTVGTGKSQPAPNRKPSYHNHPATPLLYEDFENPTGYDLAGWGEDIGPGGIINEDYTATVLYGTQSLFVDTPNDDQTQTTNSFAANGRVWIAFRFRPTAIIDPADSTVIALTDAGNTCQMKFTLNNDGGTVKIFSDCSTGTPTGFGMTTNTTYNVWIEYNKNNGANRFASIGFSTSGIRPTSGNNYAEHTSVITATDVSRIRIGHTTLEVNQEVDFILDHLIIDDEQIVNYP